VTRKLPVIGTSAPVTAFCSAKVEGPWYTEEDPTDFLWIDGNGKITVGNGTLDAPKPNALSLVQIADCPSSTPTCRKGCYVHNLEKHAPDTHALYKHNSQHVRFIVGAEVDQKAPPSKTLDSYARQWAVILGKWIAKNAPAGFRWHVSGDVISEAHARWISAVCAAAPKVPFWIYTRSFWALPNLYAANLTVNLSADRDNWREAVEAAEEYPDTRLCFMTTDGEIPEGLDLRHGDVIFPDYNLRDGTPEGRAWFEALPAADKQRTCPVDYAGKSEERRCGPCPRCLKPRNPEVDL
jgi:hypothetical protein